MATGIVAALACLVGLLGCRGSASEGDDDATGLLGGRDLLLVTIDTLRADRLGSYGAADAGTPHLDALAADGIRFANVYAPVPLTLPTHSVMFTGRYPFTTGVRVNGIHRLAEGETTLAGLFGRRGYATSGTISAYVLTRRFGLAQGFDVYEDSLGMDNLFRYFSEVPADETRRRFGRWLDSRPAGKPFFAWVHLFDPHAPYRPPPPFSERFAHDLYQGEIAFVDRELGRLLDDLAARGLEDTVIVVTSDHGEGFGEHGEEGHGLLAYDETLRVPWIVRAPGTLAGGRVIEERVSLYDLFPTLVDLFALDGDTTDLPGRSLGATLAGAPAPAAAEVYFETLAGMTTKGWAPLTGLIAKAGADKLIAVPEPELYDLAADPGEHRNLVDERRRRVHELANRLEELTAGAPDPEATTERELSDEDRRQLAALGYLSRPELRTSDGIDPKRGIAIEARLREARTAVDAGRADEAARRLAALRTEHPDVDMGELWELEHLVARGRGDREAARRALATGVDRFPDLESLRLRYATWLWEAGFPDQAEEQATVLLTLSPDDPSARSLLGLVAEGRGRFDDALGHYRRALEVEPTSVPLRAKLAETLVRTGDHATARSLYDELLAEGALAGSAEHLYKSAMLDAALGRLDRAEATFRQALEIEPGGVHYLSFALVLLQRGEHAEAADFLRRSLNADRHPLDATQRALAAQALAQLGG
ncbi:MAG TPA: sulfatase-like hydrolase/transferase [Thermoanaerobaculia bacterium]|nr:sulfatase-like hydrolase/transferase [Thermoanaerobaculia bacterium]